MESVMTSLIVSMIITEEHGKTIDIIFIDAKQYGDRKDKRKESKV